MEPENTQTEPALPFPTAAKKPARQQKAGLPKLVLAATRGHQTRREREEKRKPKGFAELDVGDFSARLLEYQLAARPSRRQRREAKEKRLHDWGLRGFFPQKGTKVVRADATVADKARGRLYLQLDNGQLVNPAKLFAKGTNRGLQEKVVAFINAKVPPADAS